MDEHLPTTRKGKKEKKEKKKKKDESHIKVEPVLHSAPEPRLEPPLLPQTEVIIPPRTTLARDELIELIEEAGVKAYEAQCRANLYRFLSIILSISFILLTALGSVMISISCKLQYVVAGMCAAAAIIKTLYEAFKIGERGTFFKIASIQLKNINWSAKEGLLYLNDWDETYRFINHIRREIDRIDLTIFRESYGPVTLPESSDTSKP